MSSMTHENQAQPTSTHIWRLVWKDCREMLLIWVTLIIASVGVMAMIAFFNPPGSETLLRNVAYLFISIVGLVSGICLFTNETESRSIRLLQNLPANPKIIVATKMVLSIIVVNLVTLITVLFSEWTISFLSFSSSRLPLYSFEHYLMPLALCNTLCVCGFLASQMARTTMRAFLLCPAILFAYVLLAACIGILAGTISPSLATTITFLGCIAVLALNAAVVLIRSDHWVEDRVLHEPLVGLIGKFARNPTHGSTPIRSRRLSLLVWQTLRQSGWHLLGFVAIPLAICVAGLVSIKFMVILQNSNFGNFIPFLYAAVLSILVFTSTVFIHDNKDNAYRFFQQNVECDRELWFARLIPWILCSVIVAGILSLTISSLMDPMRLEMLSKHPAPTTILDVVFQSGFQTLEYCLFGVTICLAAGQFCSLFYRQAILATLQSTGLGAALILYAILLYVLDVNRFVFLLPIIAALFIATWWRIPYWAGDSRKWRSFAGPIVLVATSIIGSLCGLAWFRATEFPEHRGGLAHHYDIAASNTTPENAAYLYRKAIKSYDAKDPGFCDWSQASETHLQEFVLQHDQAIAWIVEAGKQPCLGTFLDSHDYDQRVRQSQTLYTILHAKIEQQFRKKELKDLFDSLIALGRLEQRCFHEHRFSGEFFTLNGSLAAPRHFGRSLYQTIGYSFHQLLIRWAELPNQDPQLIRRAIWVLDSNPSEHQLFDSADSLPMYDPQLQIAYKFQLLDEWQKNDKDMTLNGPQLPIYFRKFAPEKQRASRLAKATILAEAGFLANLSWYLRNDVPIKHITESSLRDDYDDAFRLKYPDRAFRILIIDIDHLHLRESRMSFAHAEQVQRYTLLRLALAVHFSERGTYPDRLGELEIEFKNGFPKDVWTGKDFAYFADGLELPCVTRISHHTSNDSIDSTAAKWTRPNAPLLLPWHLDWHSSADAPTRRYSQLGDARDPRRPMPPSPAPIKTPSIGIPLSEVSAHDTTPLRYFTGFLFNLGNPDTPSLPSNPDTPIEPEVSDEHE